MLKQGVNKLPTMTAAGLLMLAMVSAPASADHGHSIVVPVVAAFALGALAYHGHSQYRQHHYYRYRGHGYRQYPSGQYGHGHYGHQQRNSHSQGGYRHQSRHSSSQGGYHKPRYKH